MDGKLIFDIVKMSSNCEKEKKEKLTAHTQDVVDLCTELVRKFTDQHSDIQETLLINAAYLHDVARFKNGKDGHHKKDCVKKVIGDLVPEGEEYEAVLEIIKQHRKGFNPQGFIWESAILRLCDKLDKFSKEEDAEEKCHEAFALFEKCGEFSSTDLLQIYAVYLKKRAELLKLR